MSRFVANLELAVTTRIELTARWRGESAVTTATSPVLADKRRRWS